MTVRKSLIVGGCLFTGAWIFPQLVAAGIDSLLSPGTKGWDFLGVMLLAYIVGRWLQGMMMGAGVLLPAATYVHSQNPAIPIRRVMTIGLLLWVIPAIFVAPKVTAAAHWLAMKRYTQADCKAGIDLFKVENHETATGVKLVYVQGMNRSPLVLSHLKIALDGDPPRATPLECDPLRKGGAGGVEEPIGPGTIINSSCVVRDPVEEIPNVKATILEAACDGAR